MNNKFNIKSVLLSSAATLLLVSGLATQANAGQINMDFTQDSATFITESTNNENGSSDYKTSAPGDLSAAFKVRLSDFNDADDNYGSNTLSITGTRSAVVTESSGWPHYNNTNQDMRLVRYNGGGLAVCSNTDRNDQDNETDCDEGSPYHAVDGQGVDESIKFAISPTFSFAVRFVTFTHIDDIEGSDNNFDDSSDDADEVKVKFGSDLLSSFEFVLDDDTDTTWRTCDDGACTVDIYKYVASLPTNSLDFSTSIDYSLGQDAIFAYLASTSGFEFMAVDDNDHWKIAGAVWVDAEPLPPTTNGVPEPASMTLLGAGIMGLGYMNRRRKAA